MRERERERERERAGSFVEVCRFVSKSFSIKFTRETKLKIQSLYVIAHWGEIYEKGLKIL